MTTTVKLDWLAGTVPIEHLNVVRGFVSDYLGAAERRDYGLHTYQESWAWSCGAVLCWTEGRREAFLSLNGDAIDFVPLVRLRRLLDELHALGLRASRVDLALDDYGGQLRLEDVEAAVSAGNFAGYRVVKPERPQKLVGGRMVDDGRGVSFGRRGKDGSGRFVQIYDKDLESKGEIPAVRLELRTSKEHADELFKRLVGVRSDAELSAVMCQVLAGSIDFVERGAETHRDRMPRLLWWARLVTVLGGPVKLAVHRVVPPLERWWLYARKAVLPSLALVRSVVEGQGYTADFASLLCDLLDEAEQKIPWQKQGRRDLGLNPVVCFG